MGIRGPLAPQEIYHIYNRGTEKRKIFLRKEDYERFVALLHLSNGAESVHISNHQGSTLMKLLELETGRPLVDIGAWCLMPNHFHLLLKQREKDGIARFMQKLTTGYTMYFNKRHERSGALFQGKFKSKHAGEDRYLKYLMSYLHLNPSALMDTSRSNLDDKGLSGYPYSSYLDYAGHTRPEGKIISKDALPLYFPTPAAFKKEMKEWLTYRDDAIKVRP